MEKLDIMTPMITSRKIPIATGAAIIFLVIIDLLMTRQILSYNNDMEVIMFILTVLIGYGIGAWILLGYTKRISQEITARSRFINLIHWAVTIIQFSSLGILLLVLFSNTTGILSPSVFAASSISATIIMGVITFKFFSWYKLSNNKNLTVLFYGIAALILALSIAEDAGTKLIMVQVIQEKSPAGATTKSSFLYKPSQKYNAEIEYKVVNPHTTTLYILPNSNSTYYNLLNSTVLPIGFVFRWIASTMLLRNVYQRIGKLPLSFWIVLSLPLILYVVGKIPGFFSGESLSGVEEPYRFYFRILFRAGTIGGNILFGFAFFMVAKSMIPSKIKDYLTIAAIGDIIVGISLSTSALQQTYGVAAHSLVLLSSYLFSMGLYLSAIAVSQDSSLRKSIKRSMVDLIDNIGSAQLEQGIKGRVTKIQKETEEQTGGFSHVVTENDMKEYMELVIEERKRLTALNIREESTKAMQKKTTPSTVTSTTISNGATSNITEKRTSENTAIETLIEKLQDTGAIVEKPTTSNTRTERRTRPATSSLFINPGMVAKYESILVNGETVKVFEFEEDFSDEVTNSLVNSLLSGNENSNDYDVPYPVAIYYHHFYKSPKLIVDYIGNNPSTMSILSEVLGKKQQTREVKSSINEKNKKTKKQK